MLAHRRRQEAAISREGEMAAGSAAQARQVSAEQVSYALPMLLAALLL